AGVRSARTPCVPRQVSSTRCCCTCELHATSAAQPALVAANTQWSSIETFFCRGAEHENTGAIIADLGSVDRSGISSLILELQPKRFRNAGPELAIDSRLGAWRVGAARHEPAGKCVPRRVFGQDGRN